MPLGANEVLTPFRLMERPSYADQHPSQQARCLGCDEWLRYDYDKDEWEMHSVVDCLVLIRLAIPVT